ncbi:MAG: PAS domain S-box protein [Methanomassiliicoccales archaeon]|jgi:PAS domain S-box-containing protein
MHLHRLDFQKIVENAEEGIFLISTEGVIQYSNHAGEAMLGYETGRLVGVPLENVLAPDSLGMALNNLDLVGKATGLATQYDLRLLTKDGRTRFADARVSMVRTEGHETWIQAIIRDNTEEKELRSKLLEEKRWTENLIEESATIIIGTDADYKVTIFNKGASKALGYSKAEVMGRRLTDLNVLQGNLTEIRRRSFNRPSDWAPSTIDGTVKTKDGKQLRISWNIGPTNDEEGGVTGIIAFGTDVTSKAALADLLQTRNRLLIMQTEISFLAASASNPRMLMEGGLKLMASNFNFARGMVSRIDSNGRLTEVGSIGAAPTEAETAVHDRATKLALATGEPLFLPEDAAEMGFGSLAPENKSIVVLPLKGRSGPVGVVCMCSEFMAMDEERKNALVSLAAIYGFALENALLAENLNRAKDQLQLYNDMITHDVVNYVMPLGSYIDLLSRKDLPEEKRALYLQRMRVDARLLDEFLRDARVLLRAVERKEASIRPVPLVHALKRSIETSQGICQNANISLVSDDGNVDDLVVVNADDALPEVFTNLFTNAVKFSTPSPVTARLRLDSGRNIVRVEVEDQGPGIPDDLKFKVFERRFSKKVSGAHTSTGLGLAIVKALVESYGGKVWADDRVKGEPDKGAKMVVELRLAS